MFSIGERKRPRRPWPWQQWISIASKPALTALSAASPNFLIISFSSSIVAALDISPIALASNGDAATDCIPPLYAAEAYEDGCYSKLRPINQSFSREFTFTQAQVDSNAKIPVTIYWIWPNTFGQFLLDEGNIRLHDRAMFDSEQAAISGVTPRQELINYICAHPNYYFESTNASITSGSTLPAYITGAMGDSPDNLLSLSNGYNNADQIIGENIQILLAEMTVGLTEE